MVMPESEGGGQRDEEERVIRLSSRHNLVSFKARYYLVDENKLRRAYIWRSFCEGFPYSDASRVQLMLPLVLELSKEAIPLLDEYPSFLMKMGLEFDQVGPARYLLRTNPQGIALKEPEMLERLLTKIPSVGPLSADFDLMELGVLIAECADVSGVRHSDAELVALELKQEGSSVPSELKGHQLLSDDILERLIHFD